MKEYHKVWNDEVERIGKKWFKPILYWNLSPIYLFEGYEGMKARLVSPTKENFEEIIDTMARVHLATWTEKDIIEDEKIEIFESFKSGMGNFETRLERVKTALKERAGTVLLETLSLTFQLNGVTRALTAEINRHRAMGFGEQSQRIADTRTHAIRLPPDVVSAGYEERYKTLLNQVKDLYAEMIDSGKVPIEQARNIMPIGLTTFEMETGNLRGWLDVWQARRQEGAMDEHQYLTDLEMEEFKRVFPKLSAVLIETGRL